MKIIDLKIFIVFFALIAFSQCKEKLPYRNTELSIEERINDLVSRMTLDEKISQMMNGADSVKRLGIPDYN
jgi:beta-glucosidase